MWNEIREVFFEKRPFARAYYCRPSNSRSDGSRAVIGAGPLTNYPWSRERRIQRRICHRASCGAMKGLWMDGWMVHKLWSDVLVHWGKIKKRCRAAKRQKVALQRGQFCTKKGLLLSKAGHEQGEHTHQLLTSTSPSSWSTVQTNHPRLCLWKEAREPDPTKSCHRCRRSIHQPSCGDLNQSLLMFSSGLQGVRFFSSLLVFWLLGVVPNKDVAFCGSVMMSSPPPQWECPNSHSGDRCPLGLWFFNHKALCTEKRGRTLGMAGTHPLHSFLFLIWCLSLLFVLEGWVHSTLTHQVFCLSTV
jgi:hypothetical protein